MGLRDVQCSGGSRPYFLEWLGQTTFAKTLPLGLGIAKGAIAHPPPSFGSATATSHMCHLQPSLASIYLMLHSAPVPYYKTLSLSPVCPGRGRPVCRGFSLTSLRPPCCQPHRFSCPVSRHRAFQSMVARPESSSRASVASNGRSMAQSDKSRGGFDSEGWHPQEGEVVGREKGRGPLIYDIIPGRNATQKHAMCIRSPLGS